MKRNSTPDSLYSFAWVLTWFIMACGISVLLIEGSKWAESFISTMRFK